METTQGAALVPLKLASLVGRGTPAACLAKLQLLEQLGHRAENYSGRLQR